jgi:hypothetical protein
MNHYHLYRLFQQMLEQNHMSERLEAIAQHIGITTEELHAQMLQYEKTPTAARFNACPDSDVYAQFLKRLDTERELMRKTLPVLGINILPFQYNQFQHQHMSGLKIGQMVEIDLCDQYRLGSVVRVTEVGRTRFRENGVDVTVRYPAWTMQEITIHDACVKTIQPYRMNLKSIEKLLEHRRYHVGTLYVACY